MAQNIDFAPTILDITKTPIPADAGKKPIACNYRKTNLNLIYSSKHQSLIARLKEELNKLRDEYDDHEAAGKLR